MPPSILTVDQVGELVQLSPEAIRRAVRRGELRASKLGGRLRVRPEDVDAWIASQAVMVAEEQIAPRPARATTRKRSPAGDSQVLALMERHAND